MSVQSNREIGSIFIVLGIMGIAFGIARLGNDIEYLPADIRSMPWFDPLASAVMAGTGLFFLIAGFVRFRRRRDDGTK